MMNQEILDALAEALRTGTLPKTIVSDLPVIRSLFEEFDALNEAINKIEAAGYRFSVEVSVIPDGDGGTKTRLLPRFSIPVR